MTEAKKTSTAFTLKHVFGSLEQIKTQTNFSDVCLSHLHSLKVLTFPKSNTIFIYCTQPGKRNVDA